ncbi:MAG: hypothetical protein K6A89_10310, partial [Treponema sp.]|nr:hypothetical protein [Treponema sp.]
KAFDNINRDRLMSFIEFPQNFKLIKKLLEVSDNEQKRKYLMKVKEISTYSDSKKFCDEITEKQYAELFRNDKDLYMHVLKLLWTEDGNNIVTDLHASFKQRMARRYNINFR